MALELTSEQINLHDKLYKKAWSSIERDVSTTGQDNFSQPSWFAQRRLKKAIQLFEKTLNINPTNWAAMWALGKIYERLGDYKIAFEWFMKACNIEKTNSDVFREAALCAMKLGLGKIAINLTTDAIKLSPNDLGLVSNLALSLLLDNNIQEAKEKAQEAVGRDPNDVTSLNTLKFINDVISGKKPYPKKINDMM